MGGKVQELLRDPMELTGILRKTLLESDSFKQECAELMEKVDKLTDLLCTAARVFSQSRSMYESPAQRILVQVYKTLDKVQALVKKCRKRGILKRMVHIISAADFRRANTSLEAAVGDVTWLLNVSAHGQEGRTGGLPPIASTEPMLAWVWEQITLVHGGSPAEKEDGASYLTSLAADNDRNRKLIIEEGGVAPLLKLLKEGTTVKGRLAAASALGTLASSGERARQILGEGAVHVFVHILQDAPMKLQSKVAWVIAKMAAQLPAMQSTYFDEYIIRPLVSLLIFESIERSTHKSTLRSITMHSVMRNVDMVAFQDGGSPMKALKLHNGRHDDTMHSHSNSSDFCFNGISDGFSKSPETVPKQEVKIPRHVHHSRVFSDSFTSHGVSSLELLKRGRENEDPETKRELKVQVVSALWQLAKDNTEICRKITETKALICLAQIMEKETEEAQRNAVMAVMEIAAAAERDAELRRFAFRMNSRAAKAVVEQLLRLIESGDTDLEVPCLRAIGCLARTFPAKETQVIEPLVYQLGNSEDVVAAEAATSLQKFVHHSNFLHVEHSKTILDAGAVHHILHLIGLNGKAAQLPALTLLCYLVEHFPSHDAFLETDTLKALKTAANTNMVPAQSLREDLISAIRHLELYRAAYS